MDKMVISGTQTGADRAGLDAAIACGIKTGGMIPKGCRTDEGNRPELLAQYGLIESTSASYPARTEANVLGSDGTVLFGNMHSPGCSLTLRLCVRHWKPYITNPDSPAVLSAWLRDRGINVLNVAGNRERTNPGIYQRTFDTCREAFILWMR